MLVQIITVDRGKRPPADLAALAASLRAGGHEVVTHRFAAAPAYAGRSDDVPGTVEAIWTSDRACLRYARARHAPCTLVLEEDCEIEDLGGIGVAGEFISTHPGEVDLFFLGASANCWWTTTGDPRVIRYSHVYWWHAVVFTRSFMERFDVPRTWRGPNDLHFSRLMRRGVVRGYGLRRQVAFQCDRRNRIAERLLYRWPWGDGRWVVGTAGVGTLAWAWIRSFL